jgi:YVTN family beta-propeller protein
MKPLYLISFLFLISTHINAQNITAANAHSHNDYAQQKPFHLAYNEGFGSIEADIHLVNNEILVGHDTKDLVASNSLENLYLKPIVAYNQPDRKLQFLIDIKTEAIATLDQLVKLLQKYPSITQNKNITIAISGNAPDPSLFDRYPSFIWFDGRINTNYTPSQLSRVALISEDYYKVIEYKPKWPLDSLTISKVKQFIDKVHKLVKPVRLWASPDTPAAWEIFITCGVDYINTDKINELADFVIKRNTSLQELPYNRIIQSAGTVVRYGKPDLENHAMDVANLSDSNLVVVQERYGFFVLDISQKKVVDYFRFREQPAYSKFMTIYSGITSGIMNGKEYILFAAAGGDKSAIMIVEWDNGIKKIESIAIEKKFPASNALPNQVMLSKEGKEHFIYTVLNGNNEIVKYNFTTKQIVWKNSTGVAPYGLAIAHQKVFVTNWAGTQVTDSTKSTAGVPWGLAYTDSLTGATNNGTVSVFSSDGKFIKEIGVGLHPNAIIASLNGNLVYVANGSSDEISVIHADQNKLIKNISVGILGKYLQGSTPNGLCMTPDNKKLFVSNGLDNAVLVYDLINNKIEGLIPTEAYPAGLIIKNNTLVVANLESDGANIIDSSKKARSIHHELASVSIIPMPNKTQLNKYTQKVKSLSLLHKAAQWTLPARANAIPVAVPERLGEPSVFKHVVYIIKENKTYDQVLGDVPGANGDSSLTVFGKRITPNMHALTNQFGLMDNYYASGKSSAEGHQWTDAGMVSDYVEKNIRAWFRSYPHRQEDALVYNKAGFIWNHVLSFGKTVKVYGEACETQYNKKLKWADLYKQYTAGIAPNWINTTTIDNLNSIIHPTFPDCDDIAFSDQQRADLFIQDWDAMEQKDSLPNLMVLSLPNDHSAGTSPDFPTPNAMVADNDLALGRIIEKISHSKSWENTVIFVTQDDSQGGWDHVSAYRTVGLVVSAYSKKNTVNTRYNQVSMLRTIEQILGLPPMNTMDATSRLMTDCFTTIKNVATYTALSSNIALNEMNKPLKSLTGVAKKMALQSQYEVFNEIDGGKDDKMNRIIWFYTKGNIPYPINDKK